MKYDNNFLGFAIKGYKAFTGEYGEIGPFNKIHLVIGKNNSGKSAIAEILFRILLDNSHPTTRSTPTLGNPFETIDLPNNTHQSTQCDKYSVKLCFKTESLMQQAAKEGIDNLDAVKKLITCLSKPGSTSECAQISWITFDLPHKTSGMYPSLLPPTEEIENALTKEDITELKTAIDIKDEDSHSIISETLFRLIPWDDIPEPIFLSSIRKTTPENANNSHINNGDGVVTLLHNLNNSDFENQDSSSEMLERIQSFLREITGNAATEIRTDSAPQTILVKTEEKYLPISALGTGIEELIILACTIACAKNKLIIIEEPESHLHPALQAQFMQYIENDPNGNRFLITTHSPSIINNCKATISHVTKSNGVSYCKTIENITKLRNALDDLGAHPSDLLQSNYVIWVEGPSDRIYINYWLSTIDQNLREGLHYSVMFYGGRLLKGLTADEECNCSELINLFKINAHFCVLMDSDKKEQTASINMTKQRIMKECNDSGNLAWVTDCNTIENYVPAILLKEAIDHVHPKNTFNAIPNDRWTNPLKQPKKDGEKSSPAQPDKLKIAKYVTNKGYQLSEDLRKRVKNLADDIRKANN